MATARVTIPDEQVFHIWECPECKDDCEVSPDFYQDNGEPMCTECDCDMEYLRTEITAQHIEF